MAKAKKTDEAGAPAPKKAPAARKPAAGKAGAAKKAPATGAAGAKKSPRPEKPGTGGALQAPRIDTGLAAQAAASMIANRAGAGFGGSAPQSGAQQPAAKQESSAFKNLKEGLSKPSIGGLGAVLGAGGGSKKLNHGFGGPRPSVPGGGGRNQTFGADVNRAGVPRRTGG